MGATAKKVNVKARFLRDFQKEITELRCRVDEVLNKARGANVSKDKGLDRALCEISARFERVQDLASHISIPGNDWMEHLPKLETQCRRLKTSLTIANHIINSQGSHFRKVRWLTLL